MSAYEPYLFTLRSGKILIDNIIEYSKNSLQHVKKIVNVFQPYYKHKKGTGLGDFIRGSYFLYQFCKIANKQCEINMKYHLISSMLENTFPDIAPKIQQSIEMCTILNYNINIRDKANIKYYISFLQSIYSYLSNCYVDDQQTMYVYVSPFPLFIVDDNERLFIKKSFTPLYIIDNMVSSMLEEHQLEAHTYHIIHIRCGDHHLIHNNAIDSKFFSSLISTIKNHINNQQKYLLIADSDTLKKMILSKLPEIIVYNYTIAHTGEGIQQQTDGIIGTLIDYTFLSGACSILSLSAYDHGSGFSKWSAETHRIPYTCLQLKSNS
jgi:hypothetical protein